MDMVRITFEYDEPSRKWEVFVDGASTPVEARQAFAAVVATCHEIDVEFQRHALVNLIASTSIPVRYIITPAV